MNRFILTAIVIFMLLFSVSCGPTSSSQGAASASSAAYVQNKGSDTIVNLALAWAEKYQAEHPDVRISVTGGGSGTGIAALLNKTVDIATPPAKLSRKRLIRQNPMALIPLNTSSPATRSP